jgi:hypothetical protein
MGRQQSSDWGLAYDALSGGDAMEQALAQVSRDARVGGKKLPLNPGKHQTTAMH